MTAQINPFYEAYETSLGKLSEADWRGLKNHWSMFSAHALVRKLGRNWLPEGFGLNGPLFKTKREAAEYVTNLVLTESRWRRKLEWDAENSAGG